MKVSTSGLRQDSPSRPLLQAFISYQGITDGAGAASGLTLVCGDLVNEPSYDGLLLKIRSGAAAGQVKPIYVQAGNTLTFATPWTNAAGAVVQITAGTLFDILSISAGSSGPGPAPTEGLSYYGIVDAVPGANQFTIASLAGLGAGKFADAVNPYQVFVLRDAGGLSALPQGEQFPVTAYATATGIFTSPGFGGGGVAVGDEVLILNPNIAATPGATPGILNVVNDIFDLVNALLVLTETGGTVTATAPGTEDNVYINDAPAGVFKPIGIMLNTSDLAGGETVIVRTRYRTEAGGALVIQGAPTLFAGVQAEPMKYIELKPNRFGVQVTIEGTAGVVYVWEVFYKG